MGKSAKRSGLHRRQQQVQKRLAAAVLVCRCGREVAPGTPGWHSSRCMQCLEIDQRKEQKGP